MLLKFLRCLLFFPFSSINVLYVYMTINQFSLTLLQLSNLDVWFQRPKDIVRKLLSGDLDLGIVGLDTFSEHGQVSIFALINTHYVLDASLGTSHVA